MFLPSCIFFFLQFYGFFTSLLTLTFIKFLPAEALEGLSTDVVAGQVVLQGLIYWLHSVLGSVWESEGRLLD